MAEIAHHLPIGQQVSLPGHFDVPVILESARPLAKGFECRVRLPDGSLDEGVVTPEKAAALAGAAATPDTKTSLVNTDQLRLLIESDLDESERDQLADEFTDAIELDQLRAEIAALQELLARARRVRDPVASIRRIESKGRKRGQTIRLTTNEWYKAVQLGDSYWLYVVWDPLGKPSPEPFRIQNPAKQLDHAKKEVVATRFFDIPAAAVEEAALEGMA